VAQRRVSSITWRQVASTDIEVGYDNGDAETVEGTHAEAGRLAQTAGLAIVRSPLGTVRWEPAHAAPPAAPPSSAPAPAPMVDEEPAADDELPLRRGTGGGAGDALRPKRIGPWLSE
jgi:hypothetical protein